MAFKCPMCGIGMMSIEIIPNYTTRLGVQIKDAQIAKCDHCDETSVHAKEIERWEKIWHVGFHDRGHGHVDYGIVNGVGKLIAKIVTGLFEDAILIANTPNLLAFAKSFLNDDCMCEPNVEKKDKCPKCRASIVISKISEG